MSISSVVAHLGLLKDYGQLIAGGGLGAVFLATKRVFASPKKERSTFLEKDLHEVRVLDLTKAHQKDVRSTALVAIHAKGVVVPFQGLKEVISMYRETLEYINVSEMGLSIHEIRELKRLAPKVQHFSGDYVTKGTPREAWQNFYSKLQ